MRRKQRLRVRVESDTKAGTTYAYANPRPTHRCVRHKKLRRAVYVFVRSEASGRLREAKALRIAVMMPPGMVELLNSMRRFKTTPARRFK